MPPPTPPQVVPTPKERDERAERRRERATQSRTEYRGTPGETATPQTTYIPPPDSGRRRSRRAAPRGGRKTGEKGGRFDRADFIPPPRALSLEDRIAGRLEGSVAPGELKPARLVEGSTVKEFAEKLGIKPKDVVTLLLQRGVFATINQALNDDVAEENADEGVAHHVPAATRFDHRSEVLGAEEDQADGDEEGQAGQHQPREPALRRHHGKTSRS